MSRVHSRLVVVCERQLKTYLRSVIYINSNLLTAFSPDIRHVIIHGVLAGLGHYFGKMINHQTLQTRDIISYHPRNRQRQRIKSDNK